MIGQATVGAGETAETRARDDAGEFEGAFRQVGRSAFLLARQLGRSTDEAMDIVQEAALRGWRYRSTRKGEFRPWFLTIVYRLSRQRMTDWFPLPAAWDPPAPTSIESSLDPELLAAMRRLPSRQRAALWLRYCDDMSTADVARIIGCSEPAAKQLLSRGRHALRSSLAIQALEEVK